MNHSSAPWMTTVSVVSGHAITAWALAVVLRPYLGRTWRWVPAAIATFNAIARVYLGAHNPLDVIGVPAPAGPSSGGTVYRL